MRRLHRIWIKVKSFIIGLSFYITAIVLGFMTGLTLNLSSTNGTVEWIYAHETLFVGMVALKASLLTILVILWQIRQRYELAEKDRLNQLLACKATFAINLIELVSYAENSTKLAFKMAAGASLGPSGEVLSLSRQFIEDANKLILLSEGRLREYTSRLIYVYQVQNVRMKRAIENYQPASLEKTASNITSNNQIADKEARFNGFLFASCGLLIESYAVLDIAGEKPDWENAYKRNRHDELSTALINLDIDPNMWPQTIAFFEDIFKQDIKMWLDK